MIYLVRANSLVVSTDWISSFEVIEPFCENPFVFEINHKLNVWRKMIEIIHQLVIRILQH